MNFAERAIAFTCNGDTLIGIASVPATPTTATGLIVVVGGPQYRVGSHRQFVQLCRYLAEKGIPCLRFDYRGMGDADGEERTFDHVNDDIRAAIDAFQQTTPDVERVALWGLCDGASAACFYAPTDHRVAGLVLLNPWVRTKAGEAKTYLKHYYLKRLMSRSFWRKVLRGKVAIASAMSGLANALLLIRGNRAKQRRSNSTVDNEDLPTRMAAALTKANLPLLFVLSGRDFVANEFDEATQSHPAWTLLDTASIKRIAEANHTFSDSASTSAAAVATASWVHELDGVTAIFRTATSLP